MSRKKYVLVISEVTQQIVDLTKFNLKIRFVQPELGVGGSPHTIIVNRKQLQRIMGNFGVARWEDLIQESFVSKDTSDKGLMHSLLSHKVTFNIMGDSVVFLTALVTSVGLNLYDQIKYRARNDLVKTLHLEDDKHLADQLGLHKFYFSLIEAQADFLYRLAPIVGRFLTPDQAKMITDTLWLFNEDFEGSEDLVNKERDWTDHKKYLNPKRD